MKLATTGLTAILALTLAPPTAAQDPRPPGPEHIARVVAVVGDSIITNFGLEERLLAYQAASRQPLPPPGPERERIERDILDDRINELLLIQAALRDTTIQVDDQEFNAAVESHIASLRQQYSTDAALEAALRTEGRTLASFREALFVQQKGTALIQRYLQKQRNRRKPPPVTDAEVVALFEQASAQVPTRPATITFEQVVLPVQPSDSALARSKELADSILAQIRAKEDFAALARRYSEDPGSKELGGDLGWFRRGAGLAREFENVAFSPYMRPGDVSLPVRTVFGYHIIKLEKVRGSERQIRHILVRPTVTGEDIERARGEAERVVERVRAGESVTELARQIGDAEEQVRVGPWPRDSLPVPYGEALAEATVGQVVGPLELQAGTELRKWAIVKVTRAEDERPATLEDYREQIRQNIARQKQDEEILDELKRRTFIDIRLAGAPPDG